MRKHILTSIILIFIFVLFFGVKSYSEYPEAVKFIKVYTENTAYVEYNNRPKYLRLVGVYVPDIKEIDKYFYGDIIEKKYHKSMREAWRTAKRNFINNVNSGDVLYIDKETSSSSDKNISVYLKMPNHTIYNINAVKEGLAYPLLYPTENKYRKEFQEALEYAIQNKKGLWRVWKEYGEKIPYPVIGKVSEKYCYNKNEVKKKKTITIMTYNVENLFDTKHDEGKNDYTYLPKKLKLKYNVYDKCKAIRIGKNECYKLDWNDSLLEKKLNRLAEVVLFYNKGKGPDFLILQEVENYYVAERLRKKLGNEYKQTVLIEGNDYRGIDCCIISKYPLAYEPIMHKITEKRGYSSRGILESSYWLPGKIKLTVLAFHFPSQGADVKKRMDALNKLYEIVSNRRNQYIIAAGDSNIKINDYSQYPVFQKKYMPLWSNWNYYTENKYNGTYYHNGNWEKFDIILFSKYFDEEKSILKVQNGSIKPVVGPKYQYGIVKGTKIPQRYKYPKFIGVSDHFPLAAEIQIEE